MKRVNRAAAFQGVYAWFCSSFALSIASSSGSVSSVFFGSGCFGVGRLAMSALFVRHPQQTAHHDLPGAAKHTLPL